MNSEKKASLVKVVRVIPLKNSPAVEVKEKIDLQHNVDIKHVELTTKMIDRLEKTLRRFATTGRNNLLLLLCPPGQDGDTRHIDAFMEIRPDEEGGDFAQAFFKRKREEQVEGSEIVGFASVLPIRSRLQDGFDQGGKVWITLGDTLIDEPETQAADINSVTVWAKDSERGIVPIEMTAINM